MGDVIGVVEAAYAVDLDEYAWVRGILNAAAPLLDRGLGAFGNTFDVDARRRMSTRATAFVGLGDEYALSVAQTVLAISPDQAERFVRMGVSTMSEAWGAPAADIDHHREVANKLQAKDFLGIVAINPIGPGMVIGAPLPEIMQVDAAFRWRWSRVAAHISAAWRLRRRLGVVRELDSPELTHAAIAVMRARGPLRHEDPDAALDQWPPIVAQRWTLIERTDGAGALRLFARENAPEVENARQAYADLGRSEDLLRYELGL